MGGIVALMDTQLTMIERIKNNLVLALGFAVSLSIFLIEVFDSVDFSTLDGVYTALPVLAAALGRLQAFGPITVAKLRAKKQI